MSALARVHVRHRLVLHIAAGGSLPSVHVQGEREDQEGRRDVTIAACEELKAREGTCAHLSADRQFRVPTPHLHRRSALDINVRIGIHHVAASAGSH